MHCFSGNRNNRGVGWTKFREDLGVDTLGIVSGRMPGQRTKTLG